MVCLFQFTEEEEADNKIIITRDSVRLTDTYLIVLMCDMISQLVQHDSKDSSAVKRSGKAVTIVQLNCACKYSDYATCI